MATAPSYYRLRGAHRFVDISESTPLTLCRSLNGEEFGKWDREEMKIYLGSHAAISRKHCMIHWDDVKSEYYMNVLGKNGVWSKDEGDVNPAEKGQPPNRLTLRQGLPLEIGNVKFYFQLPLGAASVAASSIISASKRKAAPDPTNVLVPRKKSKVKKQLNASSAAAAPSASAASIAETPPSPTPPPAVLPNAAAAAAAAAAQVPAEESVEKKPKESYYELAREVLRATPALAAAGFSIKNVAEAIAVRYPFFAMPAALKNLKNGLRQAFMGRKTEFVKPKEGTKKERGTFTWVVPVPVVES